MYNNPPGRSPAYSYYSRLYYVTGIALRLELHLYWPIADRVRQSPVSHLWAVCAILIPSSVLPTIAATLTLKLPCCIIHPCLGFRLRGPTVHCPRSSPRHCSNRNAITERCRLNWLGLYACDCTTTQQPVVSSPDYGSLFQTQPNLTCRYSDSTEGENICVSYSM